MSYANGTTHYNLPQTVGTDKRDWFDTNEAFANVDADLNTAYTTANATASNVSALTDRVTVNEGDITNLKAEDVAINARVSTINDTVSALSNAVSDNKQDLSDAICSVVEGSATAAYEHEIGTYFWYNDTLYITTVAIDIGDTIVPNTNCNTTNVTSELLKILDTVHVLNQSFNCYYTKNGNCVTLQLEVFNYTPDSTSVSVGTLPIGYRPMVPARVFNGASSNPDAFPCNLVINTNGTVNIAFKEAVISNCVFCITFFVA